MIWKPDIKNITFDIDGDNVKVIGMEVENPKELLKEILSHYAKLNSLNLEDEELAELKNSLRNGDILIENV